ncbi:putative protein N(5)-glutamine methyltransferase [Nocardiopsis sp. LOL_012]|uniref:putative protein N(5)-glutamine methyltransferase n=1 Tax=Nocardiopsis sp. LOL_012 TaxID=3345409 RepID=UPI003A84E7E1
MAPTRTDSLSALTRRLRRAGCVFAEDEALLLVATAHTPDRLAEMADLRCRGVPLEHVLGWARFCGLRVAVDPGVFVPRPRTEHLARSAAALLGPGSTAVDLCCGSGAVGAHLLRARPGTVLHAADIDPASVACARRNLPGRPVHLGDLYDALPKGLGGRVDVLVANAPYVPTGRIALLPPEARDHEDRRALDGGPDGLGPVRRVAAHARRWLAPGGHLLVEVDEGQVPGAAAAFTGGGLTTRALTCPRTGATVLAGGR